MFTWRASTSRWTIPRAFIRKRLSPWNRNVHLVIRKHFMKRNDVSWITFVISNSPPYEREKVLLAVSHEGHRDRFFSTGPYHGPTTTITDQWFLWRKSSVIVDWFGPIVVVLWKKVNAVADQQIGIIKKMHECPGRPKVFSLLGRPVWHSWQHFLDRRLCCWASVYFSWAHP